MERLLSTGIRGKIHPMAKTPIRSLCTQCRRRWAYPFYAHGRMPPWMLHAGWHRLCNECLSKLADDDAVTSATYDMWLRDRGAASGGGHLVGQDSPTERGQDQSREKVLHAR